MTHQSVAVVEQGTVRNKRHAGTTTTGPETVRSFSTRVAMETAITSPQPKLVRHAVWSGPAASVNLCRTDSL